MYDDILRVRSPGRPTARRTALSDKISLPDYGPLTITKTGRLINHFARYVQDANPRFGLSRQMTGITPYLRKTVVT